MVEVQTGAGAGAGAVVWTVARVGLGASGTSCGVTGAALVAWQFTAAACSEAGICSGAATDGWLGSTGIRSGAEAGASAGAGAEVSSMRLGLDDCFAVTGCSRMAAGASKSEGLTWEGNNNSEFTSLISYSRS